MRGLPFELGWVLWKNSVGGGALELNHLTSLHFNLFAWHCDLSLWNWYCNDDIYVWWIEIHCRLLFFSKRIPCVHLRGCIQCSNNGDFSGWLWKNVFPKPILKKWSHFFNAKETGQLGYAQRTMQNTSANIQFFHLLCVLQLPVHQIYDDFKGRWCPHIPDHIVIVVDQLHLSNRVGIGYIR